MTKSPSQQHALLKYRGKGPIVLHEADDLPGIWVSHDLSTDIMSQGDDPLHALEMLAEAVSMCLDDDAVSNLGTRPKAPSEDWPPAFYVP